MIRYKELPQQDWDKLQGLVNHEFLPKMGKAVVAEDNGQIVSFYFLSARLHAEPIWVHPAYAGKVYIPKMLKLLLQGYEGNSDILCMTPEGSNVDGIMRAISERHKFKEMPYNVWLRRF